MASTFTKSLSFALAAPVTLYVVGYFPPDKQGEKHPPHEHVEVGSGNSSSSAGAAIAPIHVSSSAPGLLQH